MAGLKKKLAFAVSFRGSIAALPVRSIKNKRKRLRAEPESLPFVQLRQGTSDEFFIRLRSIGFVEREKRLRDIDKIGNQLAWPAASLAYGIKVLCESS